MKWYNIFVCHANFLDPVESIPADNGKWAKRKDVEKLMQYVRHDNRCVFDNNGNMIRCLCGLSKLLEDK